MTALEQLIVLLSSDNSARPSMFRLIDHGELLKQLRPAIAVATSPIRVTSTRVETRGAHDHVTVWVDGANTGTLIVRIGDGPALASILGGT